MSTLCASAHAESMAGAIGVSDRRAARGDVVCRAGKFGLGRPIAGKLLDLSQDGVGILLPKPLAAGDEIDIELTPIGGRRIEARHAVVRWARQNEDGSWRIGCQFEHYLSYQEFISFVR
jgi:hypothetical protein